NPHLTATQLGVIYLIGISGQNLPPAEDEQEALETHELAWFPAACGAQIQLFVYRVGTNEPAKILTGGERGAVHVALDLHHEHYYLLLPASEKREAVDAPAGSSTKKKGGTLAEESLVAGFAETVDGEDQDDDLAEARHS
ncbi:MAG: hypothetical protein KDD47_21200, partial [Acidobacteria bacterium]|nr:hypothetical protein [Acidobacteriota bacterium]